MPLSRLEDDLLEGWGDAFSGLFVGTREGKTSENGAVSTPSSKSRALYHNGHSNLRDFATITR